MKQVITMVGVLATLMLQATPTVTNVEAKQRYPWNGLVDITVTMRGAEDESLMIPLCATVKTTQAKLPVRTVTANGAVVGEGDLWTRKFISGATADVGCEKFGEIELTAGAFVAVDVQLLSCIG